MNNLRFINIFLLASYCVPLQISASKVFKEDKLSDKTKSSLTLKREHHSKRYNTKCWPQRCYIICPIQTQPLPNQNPVFGQNTGPVVTPTSLLPTSAPPQRGPMVNLLQTTNAPGANPTNPHGIINQIANGLNDLPQILGKGRVKHLTRSQKRILAKHLILGNHIGKKAYTFRQFAPLGCYVQCEAIQLPPQVPVLQNPSGATERPVEYPPGGTDVDDGDGNGDDDEDEDETDEPYQPGEDNPIEITASPPDRAKKNFVVVDNFALPGSIFEEKHQKPKHHSRRI